MDAGSRLYVKIVLNATSGGSTGVAGQQTIYNYSGVVKADLYPNTLEWDINTLPPDMPPNNEYEISDGGYAEIANSDDVRDATIDPGKGYRIKVSSNCVWSIDW